MKIALLLVVLALANANVNQHAKYVDTKTILTEVGAVEYKFFKD